jgi:DNA-binding GntR family transcriptional regulator
MPTTDRTKSNTHNALEEIRKLIFSGELSAGSNHLESELATRLGMSRTPVREATLTLAAQGLLEVRPRKGVRIKAISPKDMDEIYEVVTELECLSVTNAANSGYDVGDLTNLNSCIEDMVVALRVENREVWAAADEAFHAELIALGGNSRVQTVVQTFNDQVRRARNLTLYMRPLPTKSNDDHRQVYDAILTGDAERASSVHRKHRNAARSLLTKLLDKNGPRHV